MVVLVLVVDVVKLVVVKKAECRLYEFRQKMNSPEKLINDIFIQLDGFKIWQ